MFALTYNQGSCSLTERLARYRSFNEHDGPECDHTNHGGQAPIMVYFN